MTNPFKRVAVPDSIQIKLEDAYFKEAKKANAGKNVFNLVNRKDFIFKDGIYSFQGQGPHFPRRIFIFNKSKLYILNSIGAFDPKGVLNEFIISIDFLKLTKKQIILYLKVISIYLQEEENHTYGVEVKKG